MWIVFGGVIWTLKVLSPIYYSSAKITALNQEKNYWFESDFCLSSASYITKLLTITNRPILPAKLHKCDHTFSVQTGGHCLMIIPNKQKILTAFQNLKASNLVLCNFQKSRCLCYLLFHWERVLCFQSYSEKTSCEIWQNCMVCGPYPPFPERGIPPHSGKMLYIAYIFIFSYT